MDLEGAQWKESCCHVQHTTSGSSDLKCFDLMQGTGCQVGVSCKPVEGEACGGRCQDI